MWNSYLKDGAMLEELTESVKDTIKWVLLWILESGEIIWSRSERF